MALLTQSSSFKNTEVNYPLLLNRKCQREQSHACCIPDGVRYVPASEQINSNNYGALTILQQYTAANDIACEPLDLALRPMHFNDTSYRTSYSGTPIRISEELHDFPQSLTHLR